MQPDVEPRASSLPDLDRRLETLERLLELPAANLKVALTHATDLVAAALGADKVDAFLYEPTRDSLFALGASNQPLSALQRKLGLDLLPLANGGRVVDVYVTGRTFVTGRLDEDPDELRGVRDSLQVKSQIGVPLEVAGERRGMMMIASQERDLFTPADVRFAESVGRWVGGVVHRAELVEEITKNAAEQGRSAVAEELVTTLAHDLRNFLGPIDLRLHRLRRRAARDGRQVDVDELDAVGRAVDRLGGVIADILDTARIDQGVLAMDRHVIDLVQLVQETGDTLSTPHNRIVVKVLEDVVVLADPARVRQCLENLLSNARKHSPRGADVTVLVSAERRLDREYARIEVIDEGPGVAPEVLPTMFERFVTGERSNGGLGLGLYVARQIAHLHQGDLTVESTPGKGARFCLTLPLALEH